MKHGIKILLAIALSIGYHILQSQNSESKIQPQSLAQFTQDVILLDGVQNGLDTMEKYRESDKFYLDDFEFFYIGQAMFRQGRIEEAIQYMNSIGSYFSPLKKSFTQALFVRLIESGVGEAEKWLKQHRYDNEYKIVERELDIATTSLLRASRMDELKILNAVYLQEFPDNTEAHHQMAEVYLKEGNEKLALQYLRTGVAEQDYISFARLASSPLSIYIPTVLPMDTTRLFRATGDLEQDTAWLFVQGGPMPDISAYHPRPLDLLPRNEALLKIDVLQSQMINPTILSSKQSLTREQNLFEHERSAEMLNRTIKYLKDRGKTVFVIAHSYGAYIAYEYLYSKPGLYDKLIVMGADLDEDLRNYEDNEDGSRKFIRFRDGLTPYEHNFWGNFPLVSILKDKLQQIFTNTGNLVQYHGMRRMTDFLQSKDLSRVVFIHARFDEANARTSSSDIAFWRDHGASVLESFGDHHSMLRPEYMANIYGHLVNGEPLRKSIASTLAEAIESKNLNDALNKVDECKNSDKYHSLSESELNVLGYQLINSGQLDEAIQIFELNAASFPDSWNAFDSLAEAHLYKGNKALSDQYYRKSLSIHPGNILR